MSSELKSLKQGCFKASFIEILRAGSKASNFMQRSKEVLSKHLKQVYRLAGLNLGKVGLKSGSFSKFIQKITDIGPFVGSWCSMELENLKNLINFTISVKHRLLLYEFCENATDCPDIHAQAVLLLSEENLRSSVPKRLNLVGQCLDWYSKSSS